MCRKTMATRTGAFQDFRNSWWVGRSVPLGNKKNNTSRFLMITGGPKQRIPLAKSNFQDVPEPGEGEDGEEAPPPVKKLGPHEGGMFLGGRMLTRYRSPYKMKGLCICSYQEQTFLSVAMYFLQYKLYGTDI